MHDSTASGHDQPSAQDARRLLEIFGGYRVSQALHVMAELGIADLLRDGAQDSDDLAQATGSHAPTLYRVLRLERRAVLGDPDGLPRRGRTRCPTTYH